MNSTRLTLGGGVHAYLINTFSRDWDGGFRETSFRFPLPPAPADPRRSVRLVRQQSKFIVVVDEDANIEDWKDVISATVSWVDEVWQTLGL